MLKVAWYNSVLTIEQHNTTGATKLKADNATMKFKELKDENFASFTDDELTKFLNTVGNYSKQFRETTTKIAEAQFADRLK